MTGLRNTNKMIETQEVIFRLILAAIFGGFVGFEREVVHRPAGLRTHMLVSMGSALFVIITVQQIPIEVARIIAGVATGIGFLGAGTIFKSKSDVQGLTTAASIWVVSAVGMAIGLGYYVMTISAVLLILLILHMNKLKFFQGL